jgi:hypothetical protein
MAFASLLAIERMVKTYIPSYDLQREALPILLSVDDTEVT